MTKHIADRRATPSGSRVRAFLHIDKLKLRDGRHIGSKQERDRDSESQMPLKRFLQIARGYRA